MAFLLFVDWTNVADDVRFGKVIIEQVMRRIRPFYAVMFGVLMLVTYLPELSLWLPRLVLG